MSPSLADGLQGAANTAFDLARRHSLAVVAGLAEQPPQIVELGGLFRIGQLPRRNNLANHVSAEGHFHASCIKRKRANKLLDLGWRGVNVNSFHGLVSFSPNYKVKRGSRSEHMASATMLFKVVWQVGCLSPVFCAVCRANEARRIISRRVGWGCVRRWRNDLS